MMELAEIIARLDMDIVATARTRTQAEEANKRMLAKMIGRRLDNLRTKRLELVDRLVAAGGDTDRIAVYRRFLDSSYGR